jgi:hypothetical protein
VRLKTLLWKLEKWRRKRRRAAAHARATGKRGYYLAKARDGRAMRKLRHLIAVVRHRRKGKLSAVHINTAPGRPHWGGAADLMGQFVWPFMAKRGLPKGSGKRTPAHNAAIGGSPTSDHLTTQKTTFARDFPTFSGEDDARALAAAMGDRNWRANSYDSFLIQVDGVTFEVQILWGAAIQHGDHVHVGIHLVR